MPTQTSQTAIPSVKELEAAFAAIEPGATFSYWSGENLARECRDWDRDTNGTKQVTRVVKTQQLRDWAAEKQQFKLGFLTQAKYGDIYDYRVTKAKEPRR